MARTKIRDLALGILRDIPDKTITSADLSSGAIDSAGLLADNVVTTAKIADNNITTAKILDGSISSTKIASGAIDSGGLLADDIITSAKISNDAVTGDKLANDITIANNLTITGSTTFAETKEKTTVDNSTTGTINFDALTQAVMLFDTDQTANRTINFRGDGSNSLDSIMSTGESMTVALLMTQGATPYYLNTYQIDSSGVTPKWQGGTAPDAGNASGIDIYSFSIVKTASATFTVVASQTQFA